MGDQQAALFGQAASQPGQAKNIDSTELSLMMNTGTKPIPSIHGVLTTVAYQLESGISLGHFDKDLFVSFTLRLFRFVEIGGRVSWGSDWTLGIAVFAVGLSTSVVTLNST